MNRCVRHAIFLLGCCLLGGCWSSSGPEVIVYCSQDDEFSRPIFDQFKKETGIAVQSKYDTESTKTTGLAQAILAEGQRPRCDVFWNSEILNTLRLEKKGLLAAYEPAVAANYPPMDRSPQGLWHGFAARARVLIVNTKRIPAGQRPRSILDLADPKWRGRSGMAKPLFGTTATQAACLFAAWGPARAKKFFHDLKRNEVQILSGNKDVARAVSDGGLDFGLTDTDDALIEIKHAEPVEIVYPDQGPGGLGTLFIPNTVAIIKGGPHPEAARRLVDYLLSPPVEIGLAEGESAQIPLNSAVTVKLRVQTPRTVHAMEVDFQRAADQWDEVAEFLQNEFTGGGW
ncbi:MAG: extracellular solute-binding protein [Thermoguttaceae bacterium]